jgi:pectin methylesterase-like acyl-CoA thioesterase
MNRMFFPARVAAALAAGVVLTACSSTATPQLDAAFGLAVREARHLQTLYPQASSNTDAVLGIDGAAAASAQQRYQDSFQKPVQTFNTHNIGGGVSSN